MTDFPPYFYLQGHRQIKDFDISKEAGGVSRATEKKLNVVVSENYLEVHLFWAGKGTCCVPEKGYYGPLISTVHAASGNTTALFGYSCALQVAINTLLCFFNQTLCHLFLGFHQTLKNIRTGQA